MSTADPQTAADAAERVPLTAAQEARAYLSEPVTPKWFGRGRELVRGLLAEHDKAVADHARMAAELEQVRGATIWGAFDDEGRLLRPLVPTLDVAKDVAIGDYKHHWSHTDEPYDWRELVGGCEPGYALWQGGYTGWKVRRLPIATGIAEAAGTNSADGPDTEGAEKGPGRRDFQR